MRCDLIGIGIMKTSCWGDVTERTREIGLGWRWRRSGVKFGAILVEAVSHQLVGGGSPGIMSAKSRFNGEWAFFNDEFAGSDFTAVDRRGVFRWSPLRS